MPNRTRPYGYYPSFPLKIPPPECLRRPRPVPCRAAAHLLNMDYPNIPHTAPRSSLDTPVSSSSTQRARLLQTLQLRQVRQVRQKTSPVLRRSEGYNIRFPNIIFPFFTIIFLPILPVPAMARIISNNTGSPSVSRIRSTKSLFASRPGFLCQNEA